MHHLAQLSSARCPTISPAGVRFLPWLSSALSCPTRCPRSASESYGPIMAGAALSAVPLLIVFLVANRRIVEGVRLSGLKG